MAFLAEFSFLPLILTRFSLEVLRLYLSKLFSGRLHRQLSSFTHVASRWRLVLNGKRAEIVYIYQCLTTLPDFATADECVTSSICRVLYRTKSNTLPCTQYKITYRSGANIGLT